MHLNGTTAGLWLIGVGSLLVAVPRLVRPDRPEPGWRWETLAERVPRLHFAAETVGALLVAAGSLVLAVVELGPAWSVVAVVVVAVLGVWLVAAAKLRQLWMMRAGSARDYGPVDPPLVSESEQRALALANARWAVCLRGAFAPTPAWPPPAGSSPPATERPADRPQPRHIAELHQQDARLEDAHVPPAVANDVVLMSAQGWSVRVVGDAVIAPAPDGPQRPGQPERSRAELDGRGPTQATVALGARRARAGGEAGPTRSAARGGQLRVAPAGPAG